MDTLLAFNLVSASWPAYFMTFFQTNHSNKKELFITKTGEAYNTTETTLFVIMHV